MLAVVDDPRVPVWLGGYSFGAEMAPVTLARMPPSARDGVAVLILLAPSPSASFRVDPLDWVRTPPVDPALAAARSRKARCVPSSAKAPPPSGAALPTAQQAAEAPWHARVGSWVDLPVGA